MQQKLPDLIFLIRTSALFILFTGLLSAQHGHSPGSFTYDDFATPQWCGTGCHTDFYAQWDQAMMSKAYTHHWDEIEYFELAVPHADKDPKLAGIKADCNGCHTPMAYLSGFNPPPRPEKNTRANESVSCEVCHSITGFEGEIPFNFNYIMNPGKTEYSSRLGDIQSPNHIIEVTDIHHKAEFCGICHNEKSPYGTWVKATQIEWKEGPYSKEGVQCQDCHMPKTEAVTAMMGTKYKDARMHLFNGAHDPGKIKGTIEMKIYPDIKEIEPGEPVKITVTLFNQKTGHKFPTGSVEDRIVWLHLEAIDEEGNKYHIPVDKKGFEGEEYTIAADALAYQDMGIPLGIENFKGVQRDGVPVGDRIFRMPYFDPQGRMTIMQWNTASFGVDYRIGPRETKLETFTFEIPVTLEPGKLKFRAQLNYCRLVKPVADYLKVPADETEIVVVNEQTAEIIIVD